LEIQLDYKNGLEGNFNWVMKNKIQKQIILQKFIFIFKFFLFLPSIFLFFMWVHRVCDPIVGGKKYHLHQVGEGN